MDILHGELVSLLVSVTFTGVDKYTSLLCDTYFTNPQCFIVQALGVKLKQYLGVNLLTLVVNWAINILLESNTLAYFTNV